MQILALTEMISSDAQVSPASYAPSRLVINCWPMKPANRGVSIKVKPPHKYSYRVKYPLNPDARCDQALRICEMSAELCLKLLGSVRIKATFPELPERMGAGREFHQLLTRWAWQGDRSDHTSRESGGLG